MVVIHENLLLTFGSFFISLLGNSIANVVLPVLILVSTGQVIVAGLAALVSGASTSCSDYFLAR